MVLGQGQQGAQSSCTGHLERLRGWAPPGSPPRTAEISSGVGMQDPSPGWTEALVWGRGASGLQGDNVEVSEHLMVGRGALWGHLRSQEGRDGAPVKSGSACRPRPAGSW